MSDDRRHGGDLSVPSHADFEELAAGFALDALEPEEEDRFLAHLPTCSGCALALEQHLTVAAQLAYAVDPVPAPPLPAGLAAAVASAPGGLPVDPFATEEASARLTATRVQLPAPRRARLLAMAGTLGVAVLLAAAAVGVAVQGADRSGGEQAAGAEALVAVNDPGANLGRLVSADGQATVHGTAVVAKGHAWLVVQGLAPSRRGTHYVAWEINGKELMRAAAGFEVSHQGATPVDLGPAPSPASGTPRYAVTVETGPVQVLPAGPGSTQVLRPATPATGSQ